MEYGGRPSYYFYSAFRDDNKNWMGTADLLCKTNEELENSVKAIKKGSDLIDELGYLQYEFLDQHKEISDNIYLSKYSDGSEIVCNYTDKPFTYRGEAVNPVSYKLYTPSFFMKIANFLLSPFN